ncbi:MAG: hypothetical protein IPK13_14705 [Deltaproteobacteria bacterium]|nr:hypothetical protein [Deltaproteobacteria bacterium]
MRARTAVSVAFVFAVVSAFVSGCAPFAGFESFALDEVEPALDQPTGVLESTDGLRLTYSILGADRLTDLLRFSASELPGLRRISSSTANTSDNPGQDAECKQDDGTMVFVDYACLGLRAGGIRVTARAETPNENGDYAVELLGLNGAPAMTTPELLIDGEANMRVVGIANPNADDRIIIAPVALLDGLPEDFQRLENVGARLRISNGRWIVDHVASQFDVTFALSVTGKTTDRVAFRVNDVRNTWSCEAKLEGAIVMETECRTPVGQGDYAVLRFEAGNI